MAEVLPLPSTSCSIMSAQTLAQVLVLRKCLWRVFAFGGPVPAWMVTLSRLAIRRNKDCCHPLEANSCLSTPARQLRSERSIALDKPYKSAAVPGETSPSSTRDSLGSEQCRTRWSPEPRPAPCFATTSTAERDRRVERTLLPRSLIKATVFLSPYGLEQRQTFSPAVKSLDLFSFRRMEGGVSARHR